MQVWCSRALPIGHERPLHSEDLIDPSSVTPGLAVLAVMLDWWSHQFFTAVSKRCDGVHVLPLLQCCVWCNLFFYTTHYLVLPSLKHHHGGVNTGVVMTHIIYYTQSWSKNSCLSIQMVTFHWSFTSLCHAPNVSGTKLHFLSSFRFEWLSNRSNS